MHELEHETESVGSEENVSLWFTKRGDGTSESRDKEGRLVALKMTDRSLCDRDDRTRVSFVREVEVLKVRAFLPMLCICC